MFDWDLFLKICKDYDVPFSTEYPGPMLEENGTVRELTPADIPRLLLPAPEVFDYEEDAYSFKDDAAEKAKTLADDLLAA